MDQCLRLSLVIHGAVQGVGFRPFIYRLASELHLAGWVNNSSNGVFIEVEGNLAALDRFQERVLQEKPIHSHITSIESSYLDPKGFSGFEIRPSEKSGEISALVLPDIATCPQCLEEIMDPSNRRYEYPFTNCTLCGPRYSIIEALPYDRKHTAMKHFDMCPACLKEYEDPANRRFHAQPNACPQCGPQMTLWDNNGNKLTSGSEAISQLIDYLISGKIAAVKGIGGFHLMVDARNATAIDELRRRKKRNEKPFAVMIPSIESLSRECAIGTIEKRLLNSPAAPIVIVRRHYQGSQRLIAENIAPGNPTVGIMLPYSPLHHILMKKFAFPLVATSGNISDEPICTDETEALEKLADIADFFLVHNRPIVRPVDDSVLRVIAGRELMFRRSRGYAPLPLQIDFEQVTVLAYGAHQKNTITLQIGKNAFISQHIGDLETIESYSSFQNTICSLSRIFEAEPQYAACDLHPDYLSSQFAASQSKNLFRVQHHYAHVLSCMAENQVDAPLLGVAWDGTGYGLDQTLWGGEFLLINETVFERYTGFKPFRLPGGEKAIKEPRRTALGILYEIYGERLAEMDHLPRQLGFSDSEYRMLCQMLRKNLNCPETSSVGRLFDGVAGLVGLRGIASFEGQAAMELENCVENRTGAGTYPFDLNDSIDWVPMINEILADLMNGYSRGIIAQKFHRTLVDIIVAVAGKTGEKKVVLSGGCFQNKLLTELTVRELTHNGFQVYWHQRVPPNDGGISLGQVIAANRALHH